MELSHFTYTQMQHSAATSISLHYLWHRHATQAHIALMKV